MSRKGFTLLEIMMVTALIGLLAAIAVPGFEHARDASRSSVCVNNLRLIDAAKEQYAIENSLPSGTATTSADCTPYLSNNVFPICPGTSTAYTTNPVGTFPTCALAGSAPGATPKSHRLD
ncbi:MAG: prepilin-type N-terminal cleavage/methylation domain-containing protein [Candidatus Omnitrophica bacterium]|nr:prepilin-type N-terminal cleavage/methylation domain-containing protein [Candidatus Omnitrophota bacterium]